MFLLELRPHHRNPMRSRLAGWGCVTCTTGLVVRRLTVSKLSLIVPKQSLFLATHSVSDTPISATDLKPPSRWLLCLLCHLQLICVHCDASCSPLAERPDASIQILPYPRASVVLTNEADSIFFNTPPAHRRVNIDVAAFDQQQPFDDSVVSFGCLSVHTHDGSPLFS